MHKNKTKVIVEAALFASLYAVFTIISASSGGLLESFFFFVLPFPIILFSLKYDIKKSLMLYVSMIIICMFFSPISTIFYIIPAGLLGIIYAYLKKNNFNEVLQIITTIVSCFIVNTLTMQVFSSLFGYNIYDDFGATFSSVLKLIDNIFSTSLASEKLIFYIDLFVPSIILLTSLIEGYLMHMICSLLAKKFKYQKNNSIPFFLVQLPVLLGIISLLFIILAIIALIYVKKDNGLIFNVSKYIIAFGILGYVLFFFQGICRLACIFLHKGKGKYFGIGLIFALLLNMLVIILGFISLFNDNRDELLYNVRWKE